MSFRLALPTVACLVVFAIAAGGAEPANTATASPEKKKIDELTAQVEALKAENAALKQRLDAAEKAAGNGGGATPKPAAAYELGDEVKLGAYKHRTPAGWNATPPKDKEISMFYRAADKSGLIFVIVKPKGGAPPEMQPNYAKQMVTKLKEDFARSKTEIIEPPAAQPDPRFYLKIHERIRVNEKQTADQTHYYIMPGKDLVQLTVITTSEDPAQVSAIQRLAEEMLLSFKAEK
jgi:outer membrane murein-binding lipoprotein Lpp